MRKLNAKGNFTEGEARLKGGMGSNSERGQRIQSKDGFAQCPEKTPVES